MDQVIDEKDAKLHSYDFILKEIEERIVAVQNALTACGTERSLLTQSLTLTKQSIDESFQRHMGTLQCRVKWLISHAQSIFHLKEGSLSQQIAELEVLANELRSCLDAADCTLNKNDEIKLMAKNVLDTVSRTSLQPCESSSISFTAYNDNMEEAIINFGDIDASDNSCEYDLLSNEGICVIESPEEKQESFEMHHLTAQSAKNEKEDFEFGFGDSALREEESRKPIEWLHRTSEVKICADNVQLQKPNPWIRRSSSSPTEIISKSEALSAPPTLSKQSYSMDKDESGYMKAQKRKQEASNMHHMNNIFLAPNSKYLRVDNAVLNSSFCSLTLLENNDAMTESPIPPVTSDKVNGIIGALSNYLTSANTNSAYSLIRSLNNEHKNKDDQCSLAMRKNIYHFNQILNAPANGYLAKQESDSQFDLSTEMLEPAKQSSITTINEMFDIPANELIEVQDISKDCQVVSTSFIKPTNAVNHMRYLENKTDEMFLRPRKRNETKTIDPEICEWLRRGSSSLEQCMQCGDFNECEFNGKFGDKLIQTATDW